jgi:membrane-associated phospholipid phosphatase
MAMRSRFTFAEQIALAFFAYVAVATAVVHGSPREVGAIAALNAVAFATMVALRRNSRRARWLAAAADLFPALLILVAYRESGFLLTPDPTHRLDNLFIQWDRVVLQSAFVRAVLGAGGSWLARYLELAYLLCYPLVPLGVAAIHYGSPRDAGQPTGRRPMEDFWAIVLLATLFCYAVYPFFPLTPPRVLFADLPGLYPSSDGLLRQWNSWLLNHYSVQACIFPSGHVAAVTAVALAVRKHTARLGGLFLFLAASVAVATVCGRYHYAADTVAGALVAVAAYEVSRLFK